MVIDSLRESLAKSSTDADSVQAIVRNVSFVFIGLACVFAVATVILGVLSLFDKGQPFTRPEGES